MSDEKRSPDLIPVYILSGGKSSRFGSDKARAQLNGEPLLCRILRLLCPCASDFTAVADVESKYADLGVRTIADVQGNLGPMGGLLTALRDLTRPEWLLLCSCDMVALECGWVDMLAAARTPDIVAVAFKGEHVEPLFALYHSDLIGDVERAIVAGELSPARLIENVSARFLPLPENWPARAHVNTPDELAQFEAADARR